MRSILVLLISLVMVTCTISTSTEFLPNFEEQQYNQSPPTNGATVVIEDDTETWNQDGTIDGHIILTDHARLNIDANMTISEGSTITVEDHSQLFLYENSSILSICHRNFRYFGDQRRLWVAFGAVAGTKHQFGTILEVKMGSL